MKSKLTPEQSQRLVELGVDPCRASEKARVYETIDTHHRWESGVPIFALSDILSLLPKEIRNEELEVKLVIEGLDDHWRASYVFIGSFDVRQYYDAPELIDALFELLVWCITNKHIEL